jgi:hypothetical protein
MIGHHIVGVTLVHLGHFKESRAHLDQAIGLYDPVEHRALATRFGSDSGVTILGFRSLAVWCLGFPETALTDADRALEDAREIWPGRHADARSVHCNMDANLLRKLLSSKFFRG